MASKTKTAKAPAIKGMPAKNIRITTASSESAKKAKKSAAGKEEKQTKSSAGKTVLNDDSEFKQALKKEIGKSIRALQEHLTKGQTKSTTAKENSPAESTTATLPVSNYRISSRFGVDRGTHTHSGIDLALPTGSQVRACEDGTVTFAGWSSGYGYRVVVDHGNGKATTYSHLSDIGVEVGQKVGKGTQIARSGNTGNSTGPHLHFEVKINGSYVNPEDYYDFENGTAVKSNGTAYTSKLASAIRSSNSSSGSGNSGKSGGKAQTKVNTVSFAGVPEVTASALKAAQQMQNSRIFQLPDGESAEVGSNYYNNNLFDVVPYYSKRINRTH